MVQAEEGLLVNWAVSMEVFELELVGEGESCMAILQSRNLTVI